MADTVAGRLLYVITGDDSGLKSSLQGSKNESQKAGKDIQKGLGGIKAGWIAAAAAVAGYIIAVRNVLSSYIRQEAADIKLRSALKATGDTTKQTYNEFKEFASDLQKITKVGDEATQEIIALGLRMGISNDKIKDATKGAIGLSQSLGIDLQSALKIVAQGMEGQFTMLGRYVPALRTATSETEKAAIFQKVLNDGFQEAQDVTDSFGGAVEQMKNAFGDAKEVFGEFVANALLPIVKGITQFAIFLTQLPDLVKASSIALITGAVAVKVLTVAFTALGVATGGLPIILGGIVAAVAGIALRVANTRQEIEDLQSFSRELLTSRSIELSNLIKSLEIQFDTAQKNKDKKTAESIKKQIDAYKKERVEIIREVQKRTFAERKLQKEREEQDKKAREEEEKKRKAFLSDYSKEIDFIRKKNELLNEEENTLQDVLNLTKTKIDEAIKLYGLESDVVKQLSEEYKTLSERIDLANKEKTPGKVEDPFAQLDQSLDAVRVAFSAVGGELGNLVGSITTAIEGFKKMGQDGELAAADWISLIIQVVQALEKLSFSEANKQIEKGNEGLGRFLLTISDVLKSFTDIEMILANLALPFGTIGLITKRLREEMEALEESTNDAVDALVEGIESYTTQLETALLNQALNAWEKYAREVININTGLNEYLDKQREFQLAREERMKQDELGILQDVLGSSLDEREKYLAQLRIDEIANEKLLEAARIEAARQQEELDKKLALARLRIKQSEFESEISVRLAQLEADEAAALAGTSSIRGSKRRLEAETMIKTAYQKAYSALGAASSIGTSGFDLERGLITGQISPDDIGAERFVEESVRDAQRPIVITLDGKQIASSVKDYELSNLLPAKAS